jgi:enoyl-CoA hydratase
VKTITLDGRGKNALGTAAMNRLLDELRAAGDAPVLLTGAPGSGAFSAGLDLKEVASLDEPRMAEFLRLLERCMTAVYLYPGPTAAAVNGHAIAGGCVLTLACDVRVMIDDAASKIGLNEVALGLRFPPRTLALVRARLPRPAESDVLLGAQLFTARDALKRGLVDELAADPVATARARLDVLAAHPRIAYVKTKRDLRGAEQDLCSDAELARWLGESIPMWTSPELRARVMALLKR